MTGEEVTQVEDLLRSFWPTADARRCASAADHLAPYPFDGVVSIVQGYHGQSTLMPEVEILRETKLRYPAIAQAVAAELRREHLQTEAGATRTARQMAEERQLATVARREAAEALRAVRRMTDAEIAAAMARLLPSLTPATADRYRKLNPRRHRPLMRLIYVNAQPREAACAG